MNTHHSQQVGPFIGDILGQPQALRALATKLDRNALRTATGLIDSHERVVLTGMGGSYAALVPTWRALMLRGKAAWLIDTAELLSLANVHLTDKTLVIAVSQSGRSAELVSLAERFGHRAPFLAITNERESALAHASHAILEIHAGPEHAVSTRTYLNSLAVLNLMVLAAQGEERFACWLRTADAIERYLMEWREYVELLKRNVGRPERLMLLARGDSMATALYAALIIKEAAKWPVEAMSAAQFRHGPLELADARFTAVVLAGEGSFERERNRALAHDIDRYGGRSFWLGPSRVAEHLRPIPAPEGNEINPIALEAVPLQLLSVALAEQSGLEPGVFQHLQKVTLIE